MNITKGDHRLASETERPVNYGPVLQFSSMSPTWTTNIFFATSGLDGNYRPVSSPPQPNELDFPVLDQRNESAFNIKVPK